MNISVIKFAIKLLLKTYNTVKYSFSFLFIIFKYIPSQNKINLVMNSCVATQPALNNTIKSP